MVVALCVASRAPWPCGNGGGGGGYLRLLTTSIVCVVCTLSACFWKAAFLPFIDEFGNRLLWAILHLCHLVTHATFFSKRVCAVLSEHFERFRPSELFRAVSLTPRHRGTADATQTSLPGLHVCSSHVTESKSEGA